MNKTKLFEFMEETGPVYRLENFKDISNERKIICYGFKERESEGWRRIALEELAKESFGYKHIQGDWEYISKRNIKELTEEKKEYEEKLKEGKINKPHNLLLNASELFFLIPRWMQERNKYENEKKLKDILKKINGAIRDYNRYKKIFEEASIEVIPPYEAIKVIKEFNLQTKFQKNY
jgi:DNA polymerase III delta prime subunit